jgi:succinate dehydrogenase/fumarate reductase flavoprotein subunit
VKLECDIAVLGAGLGGVVAAVRAAELGRRVILLEARPHIGGTALYSGGGVHIWSASTWEEYRRTCPDADPVLARTLFDNYRPFVAWAEATGAPGGWGESTNRGVTIAKYQIGDSIASPGRQAWFAHMARRLERLGGRIITGARARRLLLADGAVVGAEAEHQGTSLEIAAGAVILAAGGFQNDPERLARHVGPGAGQFLSRGVPENRGDALAMAEAAGAACSRRMDTLYGHLMPAPPCRPDISSPMEFLLLSAFYAEHGLLVNGAGQRFVDEGAGELDGSTINAAALQSAGGLWIVMDDEIRRRFARYELPREVFRPSNLPLMGLARYCGLRLGSGGPAVTMDSLAYARDRGALIVQAPALSRLTQSLARHGVDPDGLAAPLADFNAAAEAGRAGDLSVPKTRSAFPLRRPPFHAVKVGVGVSMTYGGVRIDAQARALDAADRPAPGLYAVPGAAGGVHHFHYAGALAACGVFGKIAAEAAAVLPASGLPTETERTHP